MSRLLSPFKGLIRGFTVKRAVLEDDSEATELRPVLLAKQPEEVADGIQRWAARKWLWQVATCQRHDHQIALHLIRRTPVFRFVDDIHVRLGPHATGCRLDAESESRFGKGDLGQNRRNLKSLVRAVQSM